MLNTISEITCKCKDFCEKKIKEKEFSDFLNTLNVHKRLNMYKKGMLVSMAMSDIEDINFISNSEFTAAMDVEYIYVVRFILSYIDTEDEFYQITEGDIEDMYDSGLIDYVLGFCNNDFEIMKRMFENSIKFKYLNMLGSFISDISHEENKENLSKISEIFKDPKIITSVSEIMQYNDPAMKLIKDEIFKPLEK